MAVWGQGIPGPGDRQSKHPGCLACWRNSKEANGVWGAGGEAGSSRGRAKRRNGPNHVGPLGLLERLYYSEGEEEALEGLQPRTDMI